MLVRVGKYLVDISLYDLNDTTNEVIQEGFAEGDSNCNPESAGKVLHEAVNKLLEVWKQETGPS